MAEDKVVNWIITALLQVVILAGLLFYNATSWFITELEVYLALVFLAALANLYQAKKRQNLQAVKAYCLLLIFINLIIILNALTAYP